MLVFTPQTANVMAAMRAEHQVRKGIITFVAGRHEQDFSKRSSEPGDIKTFSASKGWLHRCRNRFRSNDIKITKELPLLMKKPLPELRK